MKRHVPAEFRKPDTSQSACPGNPVSGDQLNASNEPQLEDTTEDALRTVFVLVLKTKLDP